VEFVPPPVVVEEVGGIVTRRRGHGYLAGQPAAVCPLQEAVDQVAAPAGVSGQPALNVILPKIAQRLASSARRYAPS